MKQSQATDGWSAGVELMRDKDAAGIVEPVLAQVDAWFVGGLPDNPRAAEPEILAAALRELGAETVVANPSVPAAWREACDEAQTGDRIIVFGSFFTVAAVLAELDAREILQ